MVIDMNEYSKYLLKNTKDFIKKEDYKGNGFVIISQDYSKSFFEKMFDVIIDPEHFYKVINGQGDEEKKIGTIYSSSLQSLLIFRMQQELNSVIPYPLIRFVLTPCAEKNSFTSFSETRFIRSPPTTGYFKKLRSAFFIFLLESIFSKKAGTPITMFG